MQHTLFFVVCGSHKFVLMGSVTVQMAVSEKCVSTSLLVLFDIHYLNLRVCVVCILSGWFFAHVM